MAMGKKILSIFSVIFPVFNFLNAQTDIAIGQWKSHLPFGNGTYVTQSDSKIYYATDFAVLIIDKEEGSVERLTKVEGLSNVGVSIIKYNRMSNILVVVYENGVIDLVKSDEIVSILNIPQSNIVLGEKKIFDIFMANDSIAYLAANFGISKLNLKTGLFPSTTKTPVEVHGVTIFNGFIYGATPEGIYAADLENNINLDDFNNWKLLDEQQGFPADYSSEALAVFNDRLYLEANDTLFYFDGTALNFVHYEPGNFIRFITAEGARLLVGSRRGVSGGNDGMVLYFDKDNTFEKAQKFCTNRPLYAIEDESGRVWFADEWANFRVAGRTAGQCDFRKVNSPFSANMREIIAQNDQVWIAAGGISSAFSSLRLNDGFFSLINGKWSVFNRSNFPPELPLLIDFLSIRMHPDNGKIYAASFWDGLLEFNPETREFKLYDDSNSTLNNAIGDSQRTRVSGLAFDDDNNLWVSNNAAARPLSVFTADGKWKSFSPPCSSEKGFLDIAIDAFGYKWIVLTNESLGILVFDEGDLNDPTDDRCKVLTTTNSNLPSSRVNAVEVDLDGNVWVGTVQGPVVFECNVLDSDCPGSLRIVEQDNFGAFLLEDENIQTIAVDGANRKWFGSTNGIFVQSPSGEEQVATFNVENSPLFDNSIRDIAINQETGEVFIGTDKGLQSFRTEATMGGRRNSSHVLVFPNPVRPDYDGPIAIKGLAQDANVKITDVSGQLVFETTALGGQAIWDGRDYKGRKANSGVYLVFSTSKNTQNPDAIVTKILLMN